MTPVPLMGFGLPRWRTARAEDGFFGSLEAGIELFDGDRPLHGPGS